ncbi:MAG: TetR/AcrR family transcriptional regulator [Micromonosporaceae bacterium]
MSEERSELKVEPSGALPTRRERVRASTVGEIKQTARRLLVAEGPAAISLRAIAREMGMTAPALYRYFASHEALIAALCEELKLELLGELERARDAVPPDRLLDRLYAVQRAFRGWAIAHRAEFALVFASVRPAEDGVPGTGDESKAAEAAQEAAQEAAYRFGAVFLELVVEIWQRTRFPLPEPEVMPAALREQLERFATSVQPAAPVGLAYIYLTGWIRLYGMVALEVFGHLGFALTDVEPLFEAELSAFAATVGLTAGAAPAPGGDQP